MDQTREVRFSTAVLEDAALRLMEGEPEWSRAEKRLGWWILLCPPVGWLMALGYRKCLVDEWVRPGGGKIPPWPGDMSLFREGMGALGVMAVYFTPVLALSWWLGAGVSQAGSWVDMLKYIFQGLILVPVTFPLNPILQSLHDPGYILTPDRFAIHLAAATLSVFLIPTGFMQLGRRGSFWDALRLDRGISTLVRHPVRYLLAWWVSLRLTLRAMARGVLAPWGIAWSYTGIVYVFQLVLAASHVAGDREPYSNGFLNGEVVRLGLREEV